MFGHTFIFFRLIYFSSKYKSNPKINNNFNFLQYTNKNYLDSVCFYYRTLKYKIKFVV